jgi:hypothetical protein
MAVTTTKRDGTENPIAKRIIVQQGRITILNAPLSSPVSRKTIVDVFSDPKGPKLLEIDIDTVGTALVTIA